MIKSLSAHQADIQFPTSYKALAPGQGVVLYNESTCLGGGIIDEVFFKGKSINR
jgi:tRNA U34 2-thiouridine synthase MnmA/TrmU